MPLLATRTVWTGETADVVVGRLMAWATTQAAARPAPDRLGAWNVGRCVRSLWYTLHPDAAGTPEPLQGRTLLVFDLGDRIEDAVCDFIARAGIGFVRTNDTRDTRYLDPVGRIRPDGFVQHPQYGVVPVEIKSMSNFAFQRLTEGVVDESYLAQGECYARAFDTSGTVFLGYRKETSALAECYVPRSETRWQAIQDAVAVAHGPDCPPRPYTLDATCEGCGGTGATPKRKQPHKACGGTGTKAPRLGWQCSYCPYKRMCWDDHGVLTMSTEEGKPVWHLLPAVETVSLA